MLLPLTPAAFAQDDGVKEWVTVEFSETATVLRLLSRDTTNRLSSRLVQDLAESLHAIPKEKPLILAGNKHFFSAGADLNEIAALTAPSALEFAKMGQRLMAAIAHFPAPTFAAIEGWCMGGGLDLALACTYRVAAPNAIFGHRGAALGLMTGWGGTQRLPRSIGKARALQMFCAAEKMDAATALRIGLIDGIAEDPAAHARKQCELMGF